MDAENQLILEYPAHLQKYHNNKYTLYELRENHTFEMDSQHEVLAMYVILYREGPNMMYCWTDRQLPDNYWTDCFNSGKYTLINCPPVSNMSGVCGGHCGRNVRYMHGTDLSQKIK
ncbi:unnamed protein product [Oppiella nova]|uniref:Uncharacterized protein n=1 Tax=Oppiella nova TaxID=334625 RepID=A0A7R9MSK3_9ACAR|nr:unnamed protein product [Oppiella nova]CAG2181639.1 unnamed protein product [Oppiella nova]